MYLEKRFSGGIASIWMVVFIGFIILSTSLWGTVQLDPLKIGSFNLHYIDIVFVILIILGILQRKKMRSQGFTINLSAGRGLIIFVLYTFFLIVYSLNQGANINNILRFAVRIFYFALYFYLPYMIISSERLNKYYNYLLAFIIIGIFVTLFQNLTGWQPSFVINATSMSNTQHYGSNIFRTYSPNYQWIFLLAILALSNIFIKQNSIYNIVALILSLFAIFLSFARNLYMALFTIILCVIVLKFVKKNELVNSLGVFLSFIFIGLIIYLIFYNIPEISDRFMETQYDLNSNKGTFEHRVKMLELALSYSPSVYFGAGFGSLTHGETLLSSEQFIIASLNSGSDSGVINLYFRFGIIGLVLFFFLLINCFKNNIKRLKEMRYGTEYKLILSSNLYIVGIIIQSFVSDVFTSVYTIPVLLTIIALSDIAWYVYNDQTNNASV